MRDPESNQPQVRAAGGIVHRGGEDGPEVLVVHRPRYDDWSLPKGKVDKGETLEEAALREVWEETGMRAKLGPYAGAIHYHDRKGRSKRVDWWLMEPIDGDFEPNEEVDEIRWVGVDRARELLSYDDDAELIDAAGLGGSGRD
jgi:8-oxo-dGTP pyrophosphatase MutT (NUDIX family)